MTNEDPSSEVRITVKYCATGKYFEIAVPVGKEPSAAGSASHAAEMRLGLEQFVNADGVLLQAIGRFMQASVLSQLLAEGVSDLEAHVVSEALEASNREIRTDEALIASAIRRVIVSRMLRMTDPTPQAYPLSDFPTLFDAALLFGNEDVLKLKDRWPRLRRHLVALSAEKDLVKRKELVRKFHEVLTG